MYKAGCGKPVAAGQSHFPGSDISLRIGLSSAFSYNTAEPDWTPGHVVSHFTGGQSDVAS